MNKLKILNLTETFQNYTKKQLKEKLPEIEII